MGKGSTARPLSIPREQFGDRFEGIFGVRKRVQYDPPSQCGDCGGTRKVGGRDCPICCPADDGPGKDEG